MGVNSRNTTESDASYLRQSLSAGLSQPAIEAAPSRRDRQKAPKPPRRGREPRRSGNNVQVATGYVNPQASTVYAVESGSNHREKEPKRHRILWTMAFLAVTAGSGAIVYGATTLAKSVDGLHLNPDNNDQDSLDALPTTTGPATTATTTAVAAPTTIATAPATTTLVTNVAVPTTFAPSNGEVPLAGTPIPLEVGQGGVSAIVDFCFGDVVIDYSTDIQILSSPWNQIIAHNKPGVFNSDINDASIQGSDWQRPQPPVC